MKYSGLLLACLVPFVLSAQKNFQPGYVVTSNGDTVSGFIDYREWNYTPTQILFRSSDNNSAQKEYAVSDLSFFQITGKETYRRFIVKISLHAAKLSDMGARDTSWKTELSFLRFCMPAKSVCFLTRTR